MHAICCIMLIRLYVELKIVSSIVSSVSKPSSINICWKIISSRTRSYACLTQVLTFSICFWFCVLLFLSFFLTQPTFKESCQSKWLGKTNFVEIRSFWQIFRSFDRMWHFFILSLQVFVYPLVTFLFLLNLLKWSTRWLPVTIILLSFYLLSGNDYYGLPRCGISASDVWCNNIWGHFKHLHYICNS